MGREIRRVPSNWEHPKKGLDGNYIPLYDSSYEDAADKWIKGFLEWQEGNGQSEIKYYWDSEGNPPNEEYCRESFTSEPTHYQIYETVSEGTPVSPVFETKEQIITWLIEEGYTPKAAEQFVKVGWCMSGLLTKGRFYKNIEACEIE